MGLSHSPNIVTSGMVFCIDIANKRSYSGTGTVITDLTGKGNNAVSSAQLGTTTNYGGGLRFNGVDQYVIIGNPASMAVTPSSSFTLCLWAEANTVKGNANTGSLFGRGSTGGSHGIGLTRSDPLLQLRVGSRTTPSDIGQLITISPNVPYFVAMTYTAFEQKVYINNTLNNTSNSQGHIGQTFDNSDWVCFYPNAVTGGNADYPGGILYYASMYNRALSEKEVLNNFQALRGRFGI